MLQFMQSDRIQMNSIYVHKLQDFSAQIKDKNTNKVVVTSSRQRQVFTETLSASRLFWGKSVFLVLIPSLDVSSTSPGKPYSLLSDKYCHKSSLAEMEDVQPAQKTLFSNEDFRPEEWEENTGKKQNRNSHTCHLQLDFHQSTFKPFGKVNIRVDQAQGDKTSS